MPKETIYSLIRGHNKYNKKDVIIFQHQEGLVWHNERMAVKDDPNLIGYFGEHFVNILNPNKAYLIQAKRNKIQIMGEKEDIPHLTDFKSFFEADLKSFSPLEYLGEMHPQKFSEPQHCFFDERDNSVWPLDSGKFDYMMSMIDSPEDIQVYSSCLCFFNEEELKAIIAKQRLGLDYFNQEKDIKKLDEIMNR